LNVSEPKPQQELSMSNAELDRILAEYQRRKQFVHPDTYAPWQLGTLFMSQERVRVSAVLLKRLQAFPNSDSECLEIGYGTRGWLGDLISWGVREQHIHGIELDETRAKEAMKLLPCADLRTGDASQLSWENNWFDLVIASTVFTSILDPELRKQVANEITRVLKPKGALLWYDFRVNNPRNKGVRKVSKRELIDLFPNMVGTIKSVTLAPPLSRAVAPFSWTLASILNVVPFFRTHLIGVFQKCDEKK
jgi:SAM-dependent methyltransferase